MEKIEECTIKVKNKIEGNARGSATCWPTLIRQGQGDCGNDGMHRVNRRLIVMNVID